MLKKKKTFLDKAWVLTLASCFWNSQKGHLITDYQKIYPRSKIKIDTKNHGKSLFNLLTGQFLLSKYKIIKGLHVLNDACWVFDQRSLNFKKKYWHLSDLISTIRLWNRHDLGNMRVDSRTRKIVKQKEHRSSLQNLDRSDINTSRHFLKSWTAGGNTMDPEKKKQAVFRSARGQ